MDLTKYIGASIIPKNNNERIDVINILFELNCNWSGYMEEFDRISCHRYSIRKQDNIHIFTRDCFFHQQSNIHKAIPASQFISDYYGY